MSWSVRGSLRLQKFTKIFKQVLNGVDTCMCSSVTLSTDLIVFSWFSLCDPQGIRILCDSLECTSNCCATYPILASTLPICQLAQLLLPIVFVLSFAFVFEFVFVFVYTFVQPASTLPRCQLAHSPPPIGQTNNQLCCTCWEPDQPNFRPHPCFTCGFVWIVSFNLKNCLNLFWLAGPELCEHNERQTCFCIFICICICTCICFCFRICFDPQDQMCAQSKTARRARGDLRGCIMWPP